METIAKRAGFVITHEQYTAIGSVADAIAEVTAKHRERLREQLLGNRDFDIRQIERISKTLVTLTNMGDQLRNVTDKIFWLLNRLE